MKSTLNKIYRFFFGKCLYHEWDFDKVNIPFSEESKTKSSFAKHLGYLIFKYRKCKCCKKEECQSSSWVASGRRKWRKYHPDMKLTFK